MGLAEAAAYIADSEISPFTNNMPFKEGMGPCTHSLSYSNGFWPVKVDNGEMDLLFFFLTWTSQNQKEKTITKARKYGETKFWLFFFVLLVFCVFVMGI